MEGIFQSMNYHSNALPAHQILITCFARNVLSMKLIKGGQTKQLERKKLNRIHTQNTKQENNKETKYDFSYTYSHIMQVNQNDIQYIMPSHNKSCSIKIQ